MDLNLNPDQYFLVRTSVLKLCPTQVPLPSWLTEKEKLWAMRKPLDVVLCPLIAHLRSHPKWSECHTEALLAMLISTIYMRHEKWMEEQIVCVS